MHLDSFTMPNGIRVLVSRMPYVQSVSTVIMVRTGSRYESAHEAGMSHLIEHMVFKGTQHFPTARLISEAIEGFGGDCNGGTTKEITDFSVKIGKHHFADAITVLADLIRAPIFAAQEFEKERKVILEELNMYIDSPQEWVQVLIDEMVFPNQSLGREVVGSRASLEQITLDMMQNYYHRFYTPSNILISIAGNTTIDEAQKLLYPAFGTWQGPVAPTWSPNSIAVGGPHIRIQQRKTEQAALSMSFHGVSHTDPSNAALSILDMILGNGMSSRLFQTIREERGLAYDIDSDTSHYHDTGTFDISVGCDPQHVDAVIKTIFHELHCLRETPPSQAELQRVKEYARGRMAIAFEDSFSVASWRAGQVALLGNTYTLDEMLDRIMAVTTDDLHQLAQRIFTDNQVCFAGIGPLHDQQHYEHLFSTLDKV